MGLKAKLTKEEFDKLPEAHREFYKQSGNDYILDAEGVEDVSGLKGALDKERKAAADAAKALKAEQEKYAGVDVDEYKRFKTEADNKDTEDLKKKGQFDEFIEKQNKKLADQKAEYEARLKAKDDELDKIIVDNGLRKAFEAGGVMPDRITDAVQLIRSRAKRNDKGDLIILDEDGETPLDASPETFAKELFKEQKPWLYAASGAGGSGAQGSGNGNGTGKKTIKRSEYDAMSIQDRQSIDFKTTNVVD